MIDRHDRIGKGGWFLSEEEYQIGTSWITRFERELHDVTPPPHEPVPIMLQLRLDSTRSLIAELRLAKERWERGERYQGNEGPTEIRTVQLHCPGCKYHTSKMVMSGRDPVYDHFCKHPESIEKYSHVGERDGVWMGSTGITPWWCPYRKENQ